MADLIVNRSPELWGKTWMCHCTRDPHIVIVVDRDNTYAKSTDSNNWIHCDGNSYLENPTPHPDPDAIWAQFCAAKLCGGVSA